MRENLYPVAKEGWKYLGCLAVGFAFFYLLDWELLTFFTFLALIFIVFIYRNPERVTSNFDVKSCIAPVDGKVRSIESLQNGEFGYKVVIQSSYKDVSLLRAPFDGQIDSINLQRGTALANANPLSEKLNENTSLVFQSALSDKIMIEHKQGKSFDGISIDLIQGQKVFKGHRYGCMLQGLNVLYLPQTFRLNINIGNEIRAGETLVGYFS